MIFQESPGCANPSCPILQQLDQNRVLLKVFNRQGLTAGCCTFGSRIPNLPRSAAIHHQGTGLPSAATALLTAEGAEGAEVKKQREAGLEEAGKGSFIFCFFHPLFLFLLAFLSVLSDLCGSKMAAKPNFTASSKHVNLSKTPPTLRFSLSDTLPGKVQFG